MASDLTTVAFIYKKKYSDEQVADLTTRDHPRWRRIRKVGGFNGESFIYAVRYGNPQGISGTFAAAQAAASSSKGLQFTAMRKPKFAVITLDGEAIAASEGNDGAFYDLVTMETDAKLIEMGDSFAFDLYRGGNGMRGQIASINGDVLTLTEADDARNFKEGMPLIADSSPDGSSPTAGSWEVVAVDEASGTIEVDDATGLNANDYLFRAGDPGTCMEGLEVCTPITAPVKGVDSFRGKDRGVNPTRLAGSRLNDTSNNVEDNLGLLAVKISQIGMAHAVTEGFTNPIKFWEIVRRRDAKVQYDNAGGSATIGFQYITLATPAGTIRLYADPDCPPKYSYLRKPSAEYIKHLRGLPHIVKDDGNPSLRQASANGIEARAASWCNYIQPDPAAHGVCTHA